MNEPEVVELGDSSLLVRFGPGGEDRALAVAEALRRADPPGLEDVAVAYHTLAVYFDPVLAPAERLAELALEESLSEAARAPDAPLCTIAVRYDGEDLDEVAQACGLVPGDVVELHASVEYQVRAVGFVPGFAYLGELDERLRLPRRDAPRARVPVGAVAIAGAQTAVYPLVTPGGWHLIGRTDTVMFDPGRQPASLLAVGARVRFVPT